MLQHCLILATLLRHDSQRMQLFPCVCVQMCMSKYRNVGGCVRACTYVSVHGEALGQPSVIALGTLPTSFCNPVSHCLELTGSAGW